MKAWGVLVSTSSYSEKPSAAKLTLSHTSVIVLTGPPVELLEECKHQSEGLVWPTTRKPV